MHRLVQVLLAVAGASLLVALVRGFGPEALGDALLRFGIGGFLVVFALELVLDGANTIAWRATFAPPMRPPFWRLYWIRQAGTAVNQLTPTATVGGEVVKTMLLRPLVPTHDAVAAQIATRMSYAIGQAVLVLLGLASVLARLRDDPQLALAVVAAFGLTFGGVAGFVAWQRQGFFRALANGAARLGLRGAWVERIAASADALDTRLAALYRDRPGAFAASIGWHVVGQMLSVVQLQVILAGVGAPAPFGTCLAMEAFMLVIDAATFLVPARLGVLEGGRVLVLGTFGVAGATALAVAVVVRMCQLAVAACGLAAWARLAPAARRVARPTAGA